MLRHKLLQLGFLAVLCFVVGAAHVLTAERYLGVYSMAQGSSLSERLEAQQGVQPIQGAVALAVTFYLPRPKSLPKRVEHHTKKPDLDKLLRAVKDGLKGIGYVDDAQVMSVRAVKWYAADGHIGAWISLEAVR